MKPNFKKAKKVIAENKKILAEQSLDKNPDKASLEKVMRDISEVAKKEGI